MRTTLTALLGVASVCAHASELPEIFVTQATTNDGGVYTVTINQPPSPPNDIWFLSAWGVANSFAAGADSFLSGWTGAIYEPADWDEGFDFLTFTPDLPLYLFTTGIEEQTDFDSLFGINMVSAVVYWNESYIGNPIPASSSNFFWDDGSRGAANRAGSSIGFALIESTMGDKRICTIGIEISIPLECIPISEPDMDGDGVPDAFDNCTILANPNQEDADFDGYGNACDPDLNGDDIVNVVDLGLLRAAFFSADEVADFNSDGVVNVVDLGIMRSFFFQSPGPSAGF